MNKKKQTIAAGAAALVAGAAAVTMTANNTVNLDMDYHLDKTSEYSASLVIDIPDEFTGDIAELQLNGEEVTKCILPGGKLTTVPIVYSDMDNLSVKFYKLNKYIGSGKFESGKLHAEVQKNSVEGE